MAGPPQRESDSVPSARRSAAQSPDPGEDGGDVLEGGGPPRSMLSRKLVLGIEVVCGIAVLVWLSLTIVSYFSETVDTASPTVTVDSDPLPSYRPGGVDFAVTLTNHSDAPIVIDNVSVLNEDYAEEGGDPWAPEWVLARVHPPNTTADSAFDLKPQSVLVGGDGGAAVLEVRADPPCDRSPQPQLAQIVVGWHTQSGELQQIIVPELLNAGPTSFEDIVRRVCDASEHVSVDFGPVGALSPTKRYSWLVKGVRVSFSVPADGWERFGSVSLNKSTVGPQSAEAMVYWTDLVGAGDIDVCGQWWGSPEGTMEDYAKHASNARGIELVSGPSAVTIGGQAAQHLVFTIDEYGCDPGFWYTWPAVINGAFWTETRVGDTIRVWIVDVGGKLLYIEGDTHKQAGSKVKHEIGQIIQSMRFSQAG